MICVVPAPVVVATGSGKTPVALFAILTVDGSVNTFEVFGVRLKLVRLFIRMLDPIGDVWCTSKVNVGPEVVAGKLTILHSDCSTSTPLVMDRYDGPTATEAVIVTPRPPNKPSPANPPVPLPIT